MDLKRIRVVSPFTYYLNGYDRRDFEIGEHEVPYDCAAYAERGGFTQMEEAKREKEGPEDGGGTGHARRGKKASAR